MEVPPPGVVAPSAPQPQNHRESNHGETGNGDTILALKWPWPVWPNHRGFDAHFTGKWRQITALPIHSTFPSSGPQTASPTGQAHPHSPTQDLENQKTV